MPSKDDDDGDEKEDLLRLPHWVAQEIRSWEPDFALRGDDGAWCLDTLKNRPSWFTDPDSNKADLRAPANPALWAFRFSHSITHRTKLEHPALSCCIDVARNPR